MKKLKLSLKNGEKILLNNIKTLNFGILIDDKWEADTKLHVVSSRGNLMFALEEIISIEFYIEQDKKMLFISSRAVEKGEEDGKI